MSRLAYVLGASSLALCLLAPSVVLAETMNFKAALDAKSEVPPNNSTATGTADVTVDTATKKLSWKVEQSGLTGEPTAAHFHGPAKPGENAGPVVDISANMKEGSADLTDEQLQQLQSGSWYLNIHTQQYPDGEIRGQVEATK
jgi:hypothetical protein